MADNTENVIEETGADVATQSDTTGSTTSGTTTTPSVTESPAAGNAVDVQYPPVDNKNIEFDYTPTPDAGEEKEVYEGTYDANGFMTGGTVIAKQNVNLIDVLPNDVTKNGAKELATAYTEDSTTFIKDEVKATLPYPTRNCVVFDRLGPVPTVCVLKGETVQTTPRNREVFGRSDMAQR